MRNLREIIFSGNVLLTQATASLSVQKMRRLWEQHVLLRCQGPFLEQNLDGVWAPVYGRQGIHHLANIPRNFPFTWRQGLVHNIMWLLNFRFPCLSFLRSWELQVSVTKPPFFLNFFCLFLLQFYFQYWSWINMMFSLFRVPPLWRRDTLQWNTHGGQSFDWT